MQNSGSRYDHHPIVQNSSTIGYNKVSIMFFRKYTLEIHIKILQYDQTCVGTFRIEHHCNLSLQYHCVIGSHSTARRASGAETCLDWAKLRNGCWIVLMHSTSGMLLLPLTLPTLLPTPYLLLFTPYSLLLTPYSLLLPTPLAFVVVARSLTLHGMFNCS